MFIVYHSNKLYMLKEIIADFMAYQPLKNIFAHEVILTDRPSIAQWLQIELAKQLGIAANIKFSSHQSFIWNLCTEVMISVPKDNYFSTEVMTWKLIWLLSQVRGHKECMLLESYLSDDHDSRKHFQLASCIAKLYNQYLIYRPEWINTWERGDHVEGLNESQQWQALLWKMLKRYTVDLKQSKWNYTNLYKKFISFLEHSINCPQGLPKRIFICGSTSLPPVYLDILTALGRHIDVHMMLINPCRYYWGNLKDYALLNKLHSNQSYHYIQQQKNSSIFRDPKKLVELFNPHSEKELSNPLLASWGKLGSNNMYLLAQYNLHEVHAFVDLVEDTLLTRIQRDLLELKDYSNIINAVEHIKNSSQKRLLNIGDRSISVNLCYSLQREVEVLHDRLLDLFSKDHAITTRDVIVMAVDIEPYIPVIHAVFGNAPPDQYLSFYISDHNMSNYHSIKKTFLALLDLPISRFTSQHVLTLLELPDLALNFGISEDELYILRHWLNESGIRWGLNNDNVFELNLPITNQYTWKFGLTRMLLGYAMDSNVGTWNGVLPYDKSSGCIAELIGKLADFLMKLDHWRTRLSNKYTIFEWQPLYREIINDFFVQNRENESIQSFMEQQWFKMISYVIKAQYLQKIPVSILRDKFILCLDKNRMSDGFLAGPINFCTLKSMSSIPFKVVCLLGMNDEINSCTTTSSIFDLMTNNPHIGDSNFLKDNRYLFLEALISAQELLYISYISHSLTDNDERYPSVMLGELIEYISQSHYMLGDEEIEMHCSAKNVREYLQIKHTRVPFSCVNYIIGSESHSYNSDWLPAALGLGKTRQDFASKLIMEDFSVITMDNLISFYRHPVRAFFQMRLGVSFFLKVFNQPDEEPFTLDDVNRYKINFELLNHLVLGDDIEMLFHSFRSAGILPYGAFGQVSWNKEHKKMEEIASKVRQYIQPQNVIEIDDIIGGIRITGWLQQVQDKGLVRWRPIVLGVGDGITLWIEHLLYCFSGGKNESRCFGGKNSEWHFAPLSPQSAEKELLILIEGYRQGRSYPLLLLPKTGWTWLRSCFNKYSGLINWNAHEQANATVKFISAWQGDYRQIGEQYNPYIHRVIPKLDNEKVREIQKCAELYYLPLMQRNLA